MHTTARTHARGGHRVFLSCPLCGFQGVSAGDLAWSLTLGAISQTSAVLPVQGQCSPAILPFIPSGWRDGNVLGRDGIGL